MGRSARIAVLVLVALLLVGVVLQPKLFSGESEASNRGIPKADGPIATPAATAPAFDTAVVAPTATPTADTAAAAQLSEQLQKNPGDAAAWQALGQLLARQKDYLRAAEAYSAAVDAAPNDAAARAQLGRALLFQGLVRLARRELKSALALDANNAEAQLYLGITYSHAAPTDIAAARTAWSAALALAPDTEIAKQAQQFLTTYAEPAATPQAVR
jgi:cytochrome c-type biogenesis protein CcmH/NrfG